MNRILYETSYIGNPKCFAGHLVDVIEIIGVLIIIICWFKQKKGEKEEYSESSGKEYFFYQIKSIGIFIFIFIWWIISLLDIDAFISGYRESVLGYMKGEYREIKGIVEDYTDTKNGYTFTIDGIEFEVSTIVHAYDWGYTYGRNKNVITGDGQFLKIKYIPSSFGSNSIVYIEEIVDE